MATTKYYVFERLVDLFPVESIRQIEIQTSPNTYFLFSKDMHTWHTFDTSDADNPVWKLKHTGDLRNENDSAVDIITANGFTHSDISNMTQENIADFWKDEDYDPNMLSIAYAAKNTEDFQFINKIKMNADWKILKKVHENKEVYIKVYANHDKSIYKNDMTRYKITPPTPQEGVSKTVEYDKYEQFVSTLNFSYIPSDEPSTSKFKLNKSAVANSKLENEYVDLISKQFKIEYNLQILDDLDSFYSINNLSTFDKTTYVNFHIESMQIDPNITASVEATIVRTDSIDNLSTFNKTTYVNFYIESIQKNPNITTAVEATIIRADSTYNLSTFNKTTYVNFYNELIQKNPNITTAVEATIVRTDSTYNLSTFDKTTYVNFHIESMQIDPIITTSVEATIIRADSIDNLNTFNKTTYVNFYNELIQKN